MQMLPLWVKRVGWGLEGVVSVLCWTEGGEKTLLINPFVFRPTHQERFLKDSSSAAELTQAKWTGGGGTKRVEGPKELGDKRIAFQHQQHISQQNVSPPSHFAFTTDRPHFTCYFVVVVFFFNPVGHADKLESKQTVCGGESPLIGAPPLFLRLSSAWALSTSAHVS